MHARGIVASHHVATVPRQTTCKRGLGVSFVCSSTRTEAGTDRAGRSLEAVLLDVGIEASVLGSVRQRAPELSCISVQERVEPLLQFLQSLQLAPEDLRVMLLRCPRLLSFSTQRQVMPVVQFLRDDVGFDEQQVASTLKRFPGIMGYGVKSHLVPHCHYLKSLGITEDELPQLILSRPQVLGTSIELVITYLRKWLRIERTHVGRLLWSYPLDYSLPRLVMPVDTTAVESTADSTMDESQADAGAGADAAAAAGAVQASSSGSAQQQREPTQVSMWGSPDACSWLDIDLRKGGSSGSNDEDSSSNGGSSGSSNKGGPPSSGNGDGDGGSGPASAA